MTPISFVTYNIGGNIISQGFHLMKALFFYNILKQSSTVTSRRKL
jgi:hypothetical protein